MRESRMAAMVTVVMPTVYAKVVLLPSSTRLCLSTLFFLGSHRVLLQSPSNLSLSSTYTPKRSSSFCHSFKRSQTSEGPRGGQYVLGSELEHDHLLCSGIFTSNTTHTWAEHPFRPSPVAGSGLLDAIPDLPHIQKGFHYICRGWSVGNIETGARQCSDVQTLTHLLASHG